mmetsp:Transcript_6226/g.24276  ORF Transcript_6226/g.24276 Transcript_6226/m.24276 type:complete len:144 (+) Transcript_6226:46-477(+)
MMAEFKRQAATLELSTDHCGVHLFDHHFAENDERMQLLDAISEHCLKYFPLRDRDGPLRPEMLPQALSGVIWPSVKLVHTPDGVKRRHAVLPDQDIVVWVVDDAEMLNLAVKASATGVVSNEPLHLIDVVRRGDWCGDEPEDQ